jgi:hypothetical protein
VVLTGASGFGRRDTRAVGKTRPYRLISTTARGVAASAVGTLAMDSYLYYRYKRSGGSAGFRDWETSAGLTSWDDAPAPAKVGKRIMERLLGRELPAERARLVNNATHWAYGVAAGAPYGLLVGSFLSPKVRYGIPFGASVWAAGYAVLPTLGVYRPIWEYDLQTLGNDLSAHLVFGLSTAAAFRILP